MIKHLVYCLVIVIVLAGCTNSSQESDKKSPEKEVTITKSEDGSFRIISAYELVEKYLEETKDADENKRAEKWNEFVIDNTLDDCLSGVYPYLVTDFIDQPLKDTTTLTLDMDALATTDIEETVIEALEASAKMFTGPETTACLFPKGIDMNLSGAALDAGKVSIFYSSSLTEEQLKRLVAHEYHHSIWIKKYSDDGELDLLDSVIVEGKAEFFASLVFGQPVAFHNIDSNQEKELWDRTKERLDSGNSGIINNVLYGGDGVYPPNYGYFLGFKIVEAYAKKHPDASIDEWSALPAQELYENSGYGDSF